MIPSAVYRELQLLPSLLSADFARLGEQIDAVMDAGARMIHVDVMDGHFVPNITVGPPVLRSLSPRVRERGGLCSVHLMIERPEDYLVDFVQAGADALSVHVEACPHLYHSVAAIRALGAGAGVAVNPGTDLAGVREVADIVDYVLVMTVNPGFGGQKLIAAALEKVTVLRQILPEGVAIEVDGGVHRGNIRQVVEAGANWLVAGSAVFGAEDPAAEVRVLRGLMAGSAPVW
ncbi:MAG: ribulose-phosphate 3-epimerase [Actinobacteria bacterium RBG_16_64_13]|nr:MAG: ribulose-phosphate 3-epimerase [Actinobacteria bacterium RBG_16_64_13]